MFEGGVSKSFSIFPIRVVYMPVEQGEAPLQEGGEAQPGETADTRSLPEE